MSKNELIMNPFKLEEITQQTLSIGRGSIEPATHVADGEYGWQLVEYLESVLMNDDSLYKQLPLNIPVHCADGRTRWLKGGSAIGGTFSSVIADALGPKQFYETGIGAKEHALNVYSRIKELGFKVGGHDAENVTGSACGCGGEDKLDDPYELSILGFLSQAGDEVRNMLESLKNSHNGQSLGIQINERIHELIINNAASLHERVFNENKYFSGGKDLRDAFVEIENQNAIETLKGSHKEVAVLLDFRNDIVLDRSKLAQRFDGEVQAFYVNIASLKFAADKLYYDKENADLAFTASLYYNIAATAVLAGPSLSILTRV